MSDDALIAMAERAGIAPRWRDVFGGDRQVSPDTLRAVLAALGLPAGSDAEIAESEERLREQRGGASLPPLVTGRVHTPVSLPANPAHYRLTLEDGTVIEGEAATGDDGRARLPAVALPGYHQLQLGEAVTTLAIAPARCFPLREATSARPGSRPWGLAVQLYSLRRAGDGGVGDFAGLREFVVSAASHGAAAVAISPVHAQFSADPERFSPYAPSSRSLYNVLHAECPDASETAELARLEALPLVDWPAVARARVRGFRRAYDRFDPHDPAFAAFRRAQGDVLESHARFEALHAHFYGRDPALWHWRDWPAEFRDPRNPAVARFADEHAGEVTFHAWLQFLASRGLEAAQQAARDAGMAVGLISDLAVGTDSGGSHSWSRQNEMLIGLTIGAPPDALGPHGQSWGLVGFSPRGLQQSGFSAYLEMIRAALRYAGGVRIDHVMGLTRLWVLPDGASPEEGAYLSFPEQDLLRLIALESERHGAIVLGEDLGTVPEGFRERLQDSGVMGMRVLWFERDGGWFTRPATWTRDAVAMTSTHDLPTIAGWWTGEDLDQRATLGLVRDEAEARRARDADRAALWGALVDTGHAHGDRPPAEQPEPVIGAAIAHVGSAACELVLVPLEDALGQREQPNLPGTLNEHPNWRRRTPDTADRVLKQPAVAARLTGLDQARKTT